MKLLLQEVRQQALIPTVRSFLRLYTTIDVKKLADFTELDEAAFRCAAPAACAAVCADARQGQPAVLQAQDRAVGREHQGPLQLGRRLLRGARAFPAFLLCAGRVLTAGAGHDPH
jgi:hypothetical protein